MVSTKVVYNPSYFQKFRAIKRAIDKKGSATVQELLDLGRNYAKSYVPKDTGATCDSIKTKLMGSTKGPYGKIYINPKQPQDGRHRNIANFDLVRWMHTSGRAREHFKRGNPQFLYRTQEYLNRIKVRKAKEKIGNIKIF